MKNTMTRAALSVTLAILCLLSLTACGHATSDADLWDSALYQHDATLGEGNTTLTVEVTAEERTVTFTVNTDQDTVGAALLEHDLIAGDESEFGLYLKVVNGITADYDVDRHYWAFYIDGEYAMTGVDSTPIAEGAHYQLVYSE